MLTKLRKPVPDRDRLVIIEENGVADIAIVDDIDDQSVYASSADQDYAVPIVDLKSFVGTSGRIFLLAADPEYVQNTQRLASLEKSIVLRQITHYEKPVAEVAGGIKLKDILLYTLIGVLLMAVIFK